MSAYSRHLKAKMTLPEFEFGKQNKSFRMVTKSIDKLILISVKVLGAGLAVPASGKDPKFLRYCLSIKHT